MRFFWIVHPWLRNWKIRFTLTGLLFSLPVALTIRLGNEFASAASVIGQPGHIFFNIAVLAMWLMAWLVALFYYKEGEVGRFDPLTGCLQRLPFFEELHREVRRALRFERTLALIMIDIDHFKTVNDRFGHPVGDKVLEKLGKIIVANTYTDRGDFTGRYGGEEFAIVLVEPKQDDVAIVAGRLHRALTNFNWEYHRLPAITVSIGYSSLPKDARVAEDLIDFADRALFRAKKTGRNKTMGYDQNLPPHPQHSRI